jgi:FixJ family two-component response regulator
VRESLELLIRSAGWHAEVFASAEEFLSRPRIFAPSCLVLDFSLPDIDGLELQRRIAADRIDMPIIFITSYGDVPLAVQAMKAGAIEFLGKPFCDNLLLSAIAYAIGGQLGISEITVKAHGGNVMRKMRADSLAELVIVATRLHLPGR